MLHVQRWAGQCRLQEKYMVVAIHDEEDCDAPCDKVPWVRATIWDRSSCLYKTKIEFFRSSSNADEVEDSPTNQPYKINIRLYSCMKAVKMMLEGASQMSYKLVDLAIPPLRVVVRVAPSGAVVGGQ